MSPAIKHDAYTSGRLLWNESKHKKTELIGLTVDNQGSVPNTIKMYDCFTAVSGKYASGGATYSQEDLGATNVLSGKIRKQLTVPAGETVHLSESDVKETTFLGKVYAVATTTDTDCIITCQYQLK